MSYPYSDFPGLLPLGVHDVTIEQLRSRCVTNFPVSVNRRRIFEGFLKIVRRLVDQEVAGNLVVDGSFLTEEIEPKDIDFALCVSPELYTTDDPEKRKLLDWIRDDRGIKDEYLCDCYLCVEYPQSHPECFDGIQNRLWWVDFYRFSVVPEQERGVAILDLGAVELE